MSLSLALNSALSGLSVNQQQLGVLSQNIANANTVGYSRKIASQTAQYLAGNGVGVSLAEINRRVDAYLITNIRNQSSIVGRAALVSDYMDRTQLLFGNPGVGNSINSHITNFFNTLQSLTQTPEDGSLKAVTIQNGITATEQIAKLVQGFHDLRAQADRDIYEFASIVNNDIRQIDNLNRVIAQDQALGRATTELQDQRDLLLKDMSQYIKIQTYTRTDGTINIAAESIPLLDDNVYQLSYNPISSTTILIDNAPLSAIEVYRRDNNGNLVGAPTILATGGPSSQVSTVISEGKIRGALDMRDNKIPAMLAQLDELAKNMRNEFNAIHNKGSGYPGANSYTGSHAVSGPQISEWSGQVRIAVLGANGQPISSNYSNQLNGFPPLLLDLAKLNSGDGQGRPSMQTIIDEINSYYGTPQKKVKLGNLNNIQLASNSENLPGSPPLFSFDLDLQNLSSGGSDVFVTGIQVLDDTSADITSVTQNVPDIDIAAANGFVTSNGSSTITINTSSAHGLVAGSKIFLRDITTAILPATDLNGIPLSELNDQYFTITNVTSTSFEITATSDATASGAVASTGATALSKYAEVEAGEKKRTTDDGTIDVSLSGNSTSSYYTVNVNVGVVDEDGNVSTSTISYRVDNNENDALNLRYSVSSATGDGVVELPNTTQTAMRALLVDADGNELTKVNGKYVSTEDGFLKLVAGNSNYYIAIDSLDSQELGDSQESPAVAATNRGFSHFFGLNNFFVEDDDITLAGSALNFAVEDRFIENPNLLSMGQLQALYNASGTAPTYSYQRTVGDSTIVAQLAALSNTNLSFAAAGNLGSIAQTISGYAAQIIGAAAGEASNATQSYENAKLLDKGFTDRSNAISGVNLDEELANTVIFQNAYAATARLVTVVDEMFDVLVSAFR